MQKAAQKHQRALDEHGERAKAEKANLRQKSAEASAAAATAAEERLHAAYSTKYAAVPSIYSVQEHSALCRVSEYVTPGVLKI